jgi:hypothetical protein
MGNEIVRHDHKNALEYIRRVRVTPGFQKGFPQQAVRFNVHRKSLQDILAMSNGFIQLPTFNHAFYLTSVNT